MDIDRQRIAAVRTLDTLGYAYLGGEWVPPAASTPRPMPCAALVRRADALAGCTEGSDEETELALRCNQPFATDP